eukprot:CAMPEP_0184055810 /NCGR_PEP_ID=MMETSP0956-20121227/7391_1 /TAXON_ID=627963 /ORGANISM="Aplanochytrium sp, Strain PBS07" /LENGTH=566 /DNA_ID=CAMNT_0026349691 /DNA_START=70 /DNA_END=1771 /DNA_ORIENTATION=-
MSSFLSKKGLSSSGTTLPRSKGSSNVQEFLASNPLFDDKTLAERKEAAKYFSVRSYRKDELIATQGDIGDRLYIIMEGTVEFTRTTDGAERSLRKYSKNEMFGDYALVHQSHRNTSNEKRIPGTYQNNIKRKCLTNLRARVEEAGQNLIWMGLETIPFLHGFSQDKIAQIGSFFQFQAFPKGYCIYREGDFGKRFYVLLSGECVVTAVDDLGFNLELTRIKPVKTFGEAALIEGKRREATVTTMTESTVFFMESDDFQDFLSWVPNLRNQLLDSVAQNDYANQFGEQIPVFKELTPLHKYRLGVGSTRVKIPQGVNIKEQGEDRDQNFYIIISGTVEVSKDGKKLRTLSTQDYFGEVGLVLSTKKNASKINTATVTVTSDECICLSIRPNVFQSIVVDEPALAAEISIRLLGDQVPLSDILDHPTAREAFLKHCEKEYAEENVDFWLAVRELEDIKNRVVKKSVLKALGVDVPAVKAEKIRLLKEKVERISNKFIIDDAKEMVNMSSEVRDKILEKMDKNDYDWDMFSEASKEVYNMVQADNFTRFKCSEDFETLLDSIGRYNPGN